MSIHNPPIRCNLMEWPRNTKRALHQNILFLVLSHRVVDVSRRYPRYIISKCIVELCGAAPQTCHNTIVHPERTQMLPPPIPHTFDTIKLVPMLASSRTQCVGASTDWLTVNIGTKRAPADKVRRVCHLEKIITQRLETTRLHAAVICAAKLPRYE